MSRRPTPSPPDYRSHRDRWSGLINDLHAAIAADGAERPPSGALADRALDADSCWVMVAPFPRGLVCRMMARAAYVWVRQSDPTCRAAMTPVLVGSMALVDELLAQTAREPSPAPAAVRSASDDRRQRLPYADA